MPPCLFWLFWPPFGIWQKEERKKERRTFSSTRPVGFAAGKNQNCFDCIWPKWNQNDIRLYTILNPAIAETTWALSNCTSLVMSELSSSLPEAHSCSGLGTVACESAALCPSGTSSTVPGRSRSGRVASFMRDCHQNLKWDQFHNH